MNSSKGAIKETTNRKFKTQIMNFKFCAALGMIASLPQLQAYHIQSDLTASTASDKIEKNTLAGLNMSKRKDTKSHTKLNQIDTSGALDSEWNKLESTVLPQTEFLGCHSRCTSPAFWIDECTDTILYTYIPVFPYYAAYTLNYLVA